MWKARIIWILWLIAVLCFVIFTDGTADMVLFIASIVVPVLCIIGNRFAARALTLTLTAEESAGKGQQIRGCGAGRTGYDYRACSIPSVAI